MTLDTNLRFPLQLVDAVMGVDLGAECCLPFAFGISSIRLADAAFGAFSRQNGMLLVLLDAADLSDAEADAVCAILLPKLQQRSGLDVLRLPRRGRRRDAVRLHGPAAKIFLAEAATRSLLEQINRLQEE